MVYLITGQKNLFDNMGSDVSFCEVEDCLEYFKDHTDIDFDTETRGFDPYTCEVLSAQFGDAYNQYVVDTLTVPLSKFKTLLENPKCTIVMQNAKFDLRFLYHHKIVPTNVFDTYLAERVLTTGIRSARKGLDHLVYKYCKQTMDKTVRGSIHREGLTKRVILYAAKDVAYLSEIKRKQLVYLEQADLLKAIQLDNMYVKVLAYIEYSGFKLDVAKWKRKLERNLEELYSAEDELNKMLLTMNMPEYIDNQLNLFSTETRLKLNWSSSKQVAELFNKLKVNTKVMDKKSGKEKDSVEAKVLSPQKDKHPLIPIYLRYKKKEKVVSTYGESFLKAINPKSKRIHTSFTQIMDTGRLSCGGKNRATGEEYINFQNIPATPEDASEDLIFERDCFVPEAGYDFIVSDYSGQEQIVLANQSLDDDLLEFYDKGLGDMHSFNASKIYPELREMSLKDIKKNHKDKRQIAKSAGFAINYGGNGMTIAQNLSIPVEQGEEVYKAYLAAFPGLTKYWDKNKAEALRNGYVTFNHVTKRKSYVEGFEEFQKLSSQINSDFWSQYREEKAKNSSLFIEELKPKVKKYFNFKGTIERKALNYPVQGTSADITKLAGVYIFDYLRQNNYLFKVWMPNVVHDEILVEAPKGISQHMGKVVQECMEKAGERFYNRVKLTADPYVGPDWKH